MHEDPKSAKIQSSCQSFFALLGSSRVKAACKMLVRLTPGKMRQFLKLIKFIKFKIYWGNKWMWNGGSFHSITLSSNANILSLDWLKYDVGKKFQQQILWQLWSCFMWGKLFWQILDPLSPQCVVWHFWFSKNISFSSPMATFHVTLTPPTPLCHLATLLRPPPKPYP